MKKILVATGTSENKLNFSVDFIDNYLKGKKIEAKVEGVSIYNLNENNLDCDVLVTTGPHSLNESIPIVDGMAFITKMSMETTCDRIIELL